MYFYDIPQNILKVEVEREKLWPLRYSEGQKKKPKPQTNSGDGNTATWVGWALLWLSLLAALACPRGSSLCFGSSVSGASSVDVCESSVNGFPKPHMSNHL